MKGKYIAIEGIDGSGKSTQAKRLVDALGLQYPDREILATAEPGRSSLGKELRAIAIEPGSLSPAARLLAIALDRALNLEQSVIPAVKRGAIVVSDRCFLSSLVYQGLDIEVPVIALSEIVKLATNAIEPDVIILIDTPVDMAIDRLNSTGKVKDYFESKNRHHFNNLASSYRSFLPLFPIRQIVGEGSEAEIAASILSEALAVLKPN